MADLEELIEKFNPRLVKVTLVIVATFFTFAGLYYGSLFFIPFSFAALISMLLLPVCKWLESTNFSRGWAAFSCILFFLLIIFGVGSVLLYQIREMMGDMDEIQEQLGVFFEEVSEFLGSYVGMSGEEVQDQFWNSQAMGNLQVFTAEFAISSFLLLTWFTLILVYIFFFLYYRQRIFSFVLKMVSEKRREKASEILIGSTHMATSFLSGLVIVSVMVGILNTIGLYIIGVQYALFFGLLSAVLNMIPYVGVIVASSLPALMALMGENGVLAAALVIIWFSLVQTFEDSILYPVIIGHKMTASPLAVLISFVVGALLWGPIGMLIFIPLVGMVKIFCDNIEPLQPVGYLLSKEEKPKEQQLGYKIKKWFGDKFKN